MDKWVKEQLSTTYRTIYLSDEDVKAITEFLANLYRDNIAIAAEHKGHASPVRVVERIIQSQPCRVEAEQRTRPVLDSLTNADREHKTKAKWSSSLHVETSIVPILPPPSSFRAESGQPSPKNDANLEPWLDTLSTADGTYSLTAMGSARFSLKLPTPTLEPVEHPKRLPKQPCTQAKATKTIARPLAIIRECPKCVKGSGNRVGHCGRHLRKPRTHSTPKQKRRRKGRCKKVERRVLSPVAANSKKQTRRNCLALERKVITRTTRRLSQSMMVDLRPRSKRRRIAPIRFD